MNKLITKVMNLVEKHEKWRSKCLNLIASENFSSPLSRKMYCSDIMNRYAYWNDNTPDSRYYQGNKYIQQLELLAIDKARQLFASEYVEIRPISGMTANLGVILGVTNAGDLVFEPGRNIGGHQTVKKLITSNAVKLRVDNYPIISSKYNIDIDKTAKLAYEKKPKLLTLGASIFLFPHPIKEIKKIADEIGALVSYDASHVLGLIAGGIFQRPLKEGADFMLGSTHKTFAGPQGGIIMSNNHDLKETLKLCPNFVDSHHPQRIPMLLVALEEYSIFGEEYAKQVVKNAKALGRALYDNGFTVLFKNLDFTESHTILVDVSEFGDGKSVAVELEKYNIIVNKMQVPEDMLYENRLPSGIRIGVQEMTRFGMRENEMKKIANYFKRALIDKESQRKIIDDVINLRNDYNTIQYTFKNN